jgi:hypothetical protein
MFKKIQSIFGKNSSADCCNIEIKEVASNQNDCCEQKIEKVKNEHTNCCSETSTENSCCGSEEGIKHQLI